MEENQNLVIGFLVVVILILLFSKISIQYHGAGNVSNSGSFMPTTSTQVKSSSTPVKKQSSNTGLDVSGVTAGQPTEEPANPLSGLNMDDEYMPEELRKQVQDLENRFYTHDCGN